MVTKKLVGAEIQKEIKLILNTAGGVIALVGVIWFIFFKAVIRTGFGTGYFAGAGAYLFLINCSCFNFFKLLNF